MNKKEKALGILVILLLIATITTVYLAIGNCVESKNIPDKVLPVSKVDTLTCDLYTAINTTTNESEHILIDSSINYHLATDEVNVIDNTYIVSDTIKSNYKYHKDILGVHIGIAKALSDGRIISVKADFIDQSL